MEVQAWLQRALERRPDATALVADGEAPTYAELAARVDAAARDLHERGARAGERVAIALPPGLDFGVALHACLRLGAVAVPIDLRLRPDERPACDLPSTVRWPTARPPRCATRTTSTPSRRSSTPPGRPGPGGRSS